MAHIFSLAAPAPSAYHEGNRSGDQVKFPDSGFFQGFNKPSRLEADIFELETTGSVSSQFPFIIRMFIEYRYLKTSTELSIVYNQIIASHRYLRKTFTSMAMAQSLHSDLRTVTWTSDSDLYIQTASKPRRKLEELCSENTETHTPITRWSKVSFEQHRTPISFSGEVCYSQ